MPAKKANKEQQQQSTSSNQNKTTVQQQHAPQQQQQFKFHFVTPQGTSAPHAMVTQHLIFHPPKTAPTATQQTPPSAVRTTQTSQQQQANKATTSQTATPRGWTRGNLPKQAVEDMKKWLFDHFEHPYPSEEEKAELSAQTGLSLTQVNNWFVNARVRIWRPMIEKKQDEENPTSPSEVTATEQQEQPTMPATTTSTEITPIPNVAIVPLLAPPNVPQPSTIQQPAPVAPQPLPPVPNIVMIQPPAPIVVSPRQAEAEPFIINSVLVPQQPIAKVESPSRSESPTKITLTAAQLASTALCRGNLPKKAVEHLRQWLFERFHHPYPTDAEKEVLAQQTNLSLTQVNNWFINARRRIWKPMVDQKSKEGQVHVQLATTSNPATVLPPPIQKPIVASDNLAADSNTTSNAAPSSMASAAALAYQQLVRVGKRSKSNTSNDNNKVKKRKRGKSEMDRYAFFEHADRTEENYLKLVEEEQQLQLENDDMMQDMREMTEQYNSTYQSIVRENDLLSAKLAQLEQSISYLEVSSDHAQQLLHVHQAEFEAAAVFMSVDNMECDVLEEEQREVDYSAAVMLSLRQ